MEASLTCAVCLGMFREPVTLPLCSHNFCKSCVLECGEPPGRSLHYSVSVPAQVTCPLCRKVSAIPGGLCALPVNTTLAELVRLLSLSGGGPSRERGAACDPEPDYGERGMCPEHPEYKQELFCKNCAVPCCGKCVSCNHQGIFHNVNLLDMVYQEEKLIFFNSLKKLRELHETFTKNTSDDAKDVKDTLKKNLDMIHLAFDEAYKALDLKKKLCLEFLKQQENTAIKRHEVHKKAIAHHKITVEKLLKDCEMLVDEYEPKLFLQVACSLNKRMTSNLDLMELTASHDQEVVNAEFVHVDLKAVLDAISTMNITPCTSNVTQPKFNGISFKTITKIWKPDQTPTKKYSELRVKHYENSVIQENNGLSSSERPEPTLPSTEDPNSDTGEANCAKIRRSADFSGACSIFTNRLETTDKTESKMEIAQEPQKILSKPLVFNFPTNAVVRAKEPVICSWKGAASGVSIDNKVPRATEAVKETNKVVASFCLGKSGGGATDLAKASKNGKSWKKPKTASFLQTTACAEPFKSQPFFNFSKTDSDESKVTEPFPNPFSQKSGAKCRAQGNEEKPLPEDHTAQSSSCEEFYDAKSDAEETEQARTYNSTG